MRKFAPVDGWMHPPHFGYHREELHYWGHPTFSSSSSSSSTLLLPLILFEILLGCHRCYLSSGFVVVQIHEIADVPLLLLDDTFRGVDKLAGKLNSVADVITVTKSQKKKYQISSERN